MSSVVFYPGMGLDIVTPLLCVPDVYKIIATGPIPKEHFGKGALEKTFDFICNLIKSGNNEFYEGRDVDDDHFIEFLVEEAEILKRYNFKKLGMYTIQFRYAERKITLNYYYNINPESTNDKWPFTDKIDFVIHKGHNINVFSKKNNFLQNLKPLLKDTTKLIATKDILRGVWQTSKDKIPLPDERYKFIVEQTKYRSEGQFDHIYIVNIYDTMLQSYNPDAPKQ